MNQLARIYLWEGIYLYIGKSTPVLRHASHALEIGISLDQPFRMRDDLGQWQEARALMIAPDREHECLITIEGRWVHIGIESESSLARELRDRFMQHQSFVFLTHSALDEFITGLQQPGTDQAAQDDAASLLNGFMSGLLNKRVELIGPSREIDLRIKKIINILKELPESNPSLQQLADQVGLSEGRLVHLFKQQLGIPIGSYILWIRVNQAIREMTASISLTQAAHNAGFADSAHFSRTFMRIFGTRPSEILKRSQIIQAESEIL